MTRLMTVVLLAATASLAACTGDIETFGGGESTKTEAPPPAEGIVDHEAFDLSTEQPQLLPFNVRFSRLAAVVGVPATDPIFDLVRKNRTSLGDHDFANGQQPDRLWSSSRMALWVRSLKPVCASEAMKTRYPALPADLPALIENAFGRPANDEDRAMVGDALADAAELPEATRYQIACLAVLSSAEFVVQ
jgi:hypothetical protein